MADIVSSERRSRMMSGIGPKNTKPEMLVRKSLHAKGFRYRLHVSRLPGKPDLTLPRFNAVIFVHGCFWHGHDCRFFKLPATRTEFWQNKIGSNRRRDMQILDKLIANGWRVCIVWECALKGREKDPELIVNSIAEWLYGNEPLLELKE